MADNLFSAEERYYLSLMVLYEYEHRESMWLKALLLSFCRSSGG